MKQSEILKKLINIAENSEGHDMQDCSQPSSSFPDSYHLPSCELCKFLKDAKKMVERIRERE
jgi:hypothetical protein